MTTPAMTEAPLALTDIAPFSDFIRECERTGVATRGQLQWWARYRNENGLAASGALVERRANPKSKRPMLFCVRPRFIAWMAGGAA